MKLTVSALQRIKLGVMLGSHRCEDIKSMTEFSDLFKLLRASESVIKEFTFFAGQELMIKAEDAEKATTEVELTDQQKDLLKRFISEYKQGWSVSDADWVQALLAQL